MLCPLDGVISHIEMPTSTPSSRSATPTAYHESPQPQQPGKTVKFPLNPVQSELSADESYHAEHHDDGSRKRRRRRDDHGRRDHNSRSRSRSHSPGGHSDAEEYSDATVDLPPRFDSEGRPVTERGEDSLEHTLQDLFQSDFVKNLAGNFLGNSSGGASSSRRR